MRRGGTYRHDPFVDRWVLVAPERGLMPRPPTATASAAALERESLPRIDGPCPFCPGNEHHAEVELVRTPEAGPWRIRVVRNRYPAVRPQVSLDEPLPGGRARPATGAQEIVVETPDHEADLVDLPTTDIARVLRVYSERLAVLEALPGIERVSLFRNRGRAAGSSQPHAHAQLVATTVSGPEHAARWEQASAHHRRAGVDLLTATLAKELEARARIVHESDRFVVLCPFAPSQSGEVWIVPREAGASFSGTNDASLYELALLLPPTVRAARQASGRVPYNLVFRLPPPARRTDPAAFWTLEVLPRGGGGAGYELSTGMAMVSLAPEAVAERMREIFPGELERPA